MNKIVSLPLAAAASVALPAAAAAVPTENPPMARAEQLVEILRGKHWAGWSGAR